MRSQLFVTLSMLAPLAAGCNNTTDSTRGQGLIAKCDIAIATAAISLGSGSGSGGSGSGGSGSGSGSGLPTSPDQCPACRDADGKVLDPSMCVVHEGVCMVSSDNPGADAVELTQTLQVIQAATDSPAIAYYGACDNKGATCDDGREFAYGVVGNELAVATFSGGVTTVYAIPAGAAAVKTGKPVFPLLTPGTGYANPNVHVQFRNAAGVVVDGDGDMQDDCRVVASASGPPVNGEQVDNLPPCWCTQC